MQLDIQDKQEEIIPFKHQVLVRQSDLIPLKALEIPITIIGAGAIGSFTTLSLAKMGYEDITVYDFDTLEAANMNSQFYRISDIGKPKVKALFDLVKDFTGVEIKPKNEKYEKGVFPGIVISAVDSMAVRKLIWENHKLLPFNTAIFIDGRMAAEFATAFAIKPLDEKDRKSYDKTLFSDAEGLEERCTAKATMYCSLALASHIAKIVKDFTTDGNYCRIMNWDLRTYGQECHLKQPKPKAQL